MNPIVELGVQFLGAWGIGYAAGFLIYSFRKIGENVV